MPVIIPRYALIYLLSSVLVIAALLPINLYASQQRVALVIGNSSYTEGRLLNAVNDASLMTRTLQSKGFDVTTLKNATQRQMNDAIRNFTTSLTQQSVGLFYFAGHGIEVNGANYLIPVDAEIHNEVDVEYEAVHAGRLLDGLKHANSGLNLVILDACRNNPYARVSRSSSRGLSRMQPTSGSLILYATEPGKVASDGSGKNGVFTQHLVNAINQQNYSIEKVFKVTARNVSRATSKQQIPYIEGVILGEFYFDGEPQSNSQQVSTPGNDVNGNHENIFWDAVQLEQSVAMYQAYVDQYPDGYFVRLAKIKIRQLGDGETVEPAAPPAINDSSAISGRYLDSNRNVFTIKQQGQKITASYSVDGILTGTRSGNNIVFRYAGTHSSIAINGRRKGSGELAIVDSGNRLVGIVGSGSFELIKSE